MVPVGSKTKMVRLSKEQIDEKLNFIKNYISANNAADGSTFDPNSNVTNKNVATMLAELNKDFNIQVQRAIIYNRLKEMFNDDIADKFISQLEKHEIYCHDETAPLPYCVAISMYPFLLNGLADFGGEAIPPKHLSSFNGEFINLIYAIASQFCGAVATVEYLTYFDYFAAKDYGEDYLNTHTDIIKQELQQTVYALNQPASARNYQSVFWNISIFDKNYFNSLFGNFYFTDGTKPVWDRVNKLQKFFMRWFNQERTKALLTFPVVTVSLLNDGNDYVDKEYADFVAEELSKGNSFFIYTSNTVDSLSSCCFSKDTKVLWKSSSLGVKVSTLEELYNLKWEPNKKNLRIFHNGSWIKGKPIKLSNRSMYKITTSNNKEFIMTDNHINVTYDGEKTTDKLTTNDYLMFNTSTLQSINELDEHLTYEMGFAVGAFLGDGSFGSEIKGTIYDINYSLNESCYHKYMDIIDTANKQLNGVNNSRLNSVYNNVYPVRISSKELAAFIQKWTLWHRGTYAYNKTLNLDCLLQSYEFRKGILDGWYETDGGNSNRCYTSSKQLAESMEILITSLGMNSSINVEDRTNEDVIIRNKIYSRNYPLWCVRWYEPCNKRSMKDVYKWKNNSQYFKITSIEKVEYNDEVYCIECTNTDEPYFTLPNGLITHNCRLRNGIKDQLNDFSYSLGAGGIMTGSMNVITLNMNRFIQDSVKYAKQHNTDIKTTIEEHLKNQIYLIHKYQLAFKDYFTDLFNANMLPAYTANYINLDKQYLTVGVNGLMEGLEYLGYKPSNNKEYKDTVGWLLKIISDANKKTCSKIPNLKLNTEIVPAESLGVKFAKWDKIDNYVVPRDCYNSYLYPVEDEDLTIVDKFEMHGAETLSQCDGGSALHLNLENIPTKETCKKILNLAVKSGCPYFCTNVKVTICNDCGYINKKTENHCVKCGSKNVDYATRVIG